jgi:Ca2+-binding RTX toxin-like protein
VTGPNSNSFVNSISLALGLDISQYITPANELAAQLQTGAGYANLHDDIRDQVTFNITGTDGDDWFYSGGKDDNLAGGKGEDELHGGGGKDTVTGGDGVDMLYGDAEDDIIDGGSGADQLFGGSGNDRFKGDFSGDKIDGGAGRDVLSFEDSTTGANFNGGTTDLDVSGAEVVFGSSRNDELTLGGTFEEMHGGAGEDQLSASGVITDVVLVGGTDKDTLTGGSGDDLLVGGAIGFDGAVPVMDRLQEHEQDNVADILAGGAGFDTYVTDQRSYGVSVPFLVTIDKSADVQQRLDEYVPLMDKVFDSDGRGVVNPHSLPNGADTEILWRPFDLEGTDAYLQQTGQFHKVGWDFMGKTGAMSNNQYWAKIVGDEIVVCFAWLTAEHPGNPVVGADNSTYFGITFEYKIDVSVAFPNPGGVQRLAVNPDALAATSSGNDGYFLGMRFATALNQVSGTVADETLTGSTASDYVQGREGADVINARDGNDIVDGGDGNDIVRGGTGNDDLFGDAGNDRLLGGVGHDRLEGGIGDDLLSGGSGEDRLDGGSGSDTLHYGASLAGVSIDIGANSATGGDATGDVIFNFENVTGSQLADTLAGTDGNNVLRGLGGADSLIGRGGNDTLLGGDGNDSLQGGDGNDNLRGEAGSDVLDGGIGTDTADYRTAASGVVAHLVNGGTGGDALGDTYVSVENLVGSGFADNLAGSADANRMTGGEGDDSLTGLGGADVFVFALGSGADHISDFSAGKGRTDRIQFTDSQFADYASLLLASVDVNGSCVIAINASDSITLDGVLTAQLHADDFLFA